MSDSGGGTCLWSELHRVGLMLLFQPTLCSDVWKRLKVQWSVVDGSFRGVLNGRVHGEVMSMMVASRHHRIWPIGVFILEILQGPQMRLVPNGQRDYCGHPYLEACLFLAPVNTSKDNKNATDQDSRGREPHQWPILKILLVLMH